jgi:phospholipase/carboxylesterase
MSKITKFYDFGNKKNPDYLFIILHGYGANGKNLIGLGQVFNKAFPNAYFIAPNAPQDHELGSYDGFQWFSLIDRSHDVIAPEVNKANQGLNEFINKNLNNFSLKKENIIIVGFSQGAMMAMYSALDSLEEYKAVIAFSGRLILPEWLGKKTNSKPKICIIHGMNDDVVSCENADLAYNELKNIGILAEKNLLDNLYHEIDIRGVNIANKFLEKV